MSPAAAPLVLVVDDEKLIRWSVGERLRRGGYRVAAVETGEAALEAIAAEVPRAMLLDVRLPGIDGLETLGRALTLSPDTRVIMISAHATVDLAVQAMKRGACDFLVKPFAFQALDEAVARALASASVREEIAAMEGTPRRGAAALIGGSPAMARLRSVVERMAQSDSSTVLIEGESGAGKEVVARAVHECSARAPREFLQVNCAALPEQLLESELFGHERGAFTDARERKRGLLEAAAGGSLLLDEIGDLPAGGQAKLLRVLETRAFRRLGGVQELATDVRLIAATNVDLEQRVAKGRFRPDLFYRLNVLRIHVPALREHREDVPELVAHFVAHFNRALGRAVRGVAPEAMAALASRAWPGNVRELRNAVERAFILHGTAEELRPEFFPPSSPTPAPSNAAAAGEGGLALDAVEKRLILEAMEKSGGNQSAAARLLEISRDTLRYRLKKHGIL